MYIEILTPLHMEMKISDILVSQPDPGNTQSPFSEITSAFGVHIDYFPFFKIEPLTAKEFRAQKVTTRDYTAIFFSAKSSISEFLVLSIIDCNNSLTC